MAVDRLLRVKQITVMRAMLGVKSTRGVAIAAQYGVLTSSIYCTLRLKPLKITVSINSVSKV